MGTETLCQAQFQGKILLTPREAAKALGISERTLYSLTAAGRIKATWLSSQTKRYTVEALRAFVNVLPDVQPEPQTRGEN